MDRIIEIVNNVNLYDKVRFAKEFASLPLSP